jgi:hypothetical protein
MAQSKHPQSLIDARRFGLEAMLQYGYHKRTEQVTGETPVVDSD